MICITPNGLISWVSPAYGGTGRTWDAYIVRDSGFLDLLESYDQIMADRRFKIKTDLALKQCTLGIPPSAASGCQMVSRDVKKTCTVANVCIYVEQVNKNLKDYQILKSEMQLKYLPIIDDIIRTFFVL